MYPSERDIDEEYERKREHQRSEAFKTKQSSDEEMMVVFDNHSDNDNVDLNDTSYDSVGNTSISRSGHVVQTEIYSEEKFDKPPLRKVKVCTDEIKSTISSVSVHAEISIEMARIAAETFCKIFYGYQYYLSINEKTQQYSDVFPDAKTIRNYKHDQALEREADAAIALLNNAHTSKAILHFDTTKRNIVEGDWPSLIIDIRSQPKSSRPFTLRSLFSAFEDRTNIAR